MLPTSALDYHLDPGRIATAPATPRDSARMMVVHRASDRVEHRLVRDLPDYLGAEDLLVVNRTRVMPARFKAVRERDGRETEGLFEHPLQGRRWHAFLRGARRFHEGDRLMLAAPGGAGGERASITLGPRSDEGFLVDFDGEEAVDRIIERMGWTPLPPYILKARRSAGRDSQDRADYQTVYARGDEHASVAAPTAGLHFTPGLLQRLETKGVQRSEVVLQVGAGTFKPVETEFVEEHRMHREWFRLPVETGRELQRRLALRRSAAAPAGMAAPAPPTVGGRIVAVGTTTVRVLETLPEPLPGDEVFEGHTTLMILPETPIRRVDSLLTNFHLPRSTLLSLVAAFTGLPRLKDLYALAQREGYRFYSFGDAMLIL